MRRRTRFEVAADELRAFRHSGKSVPAAGGAQVPGRVDGGEELLCFAAPIGFETRWCVGADGCTLVVAITVKIGEVRNAPMSTRNSPMNPFVPGTPIELSDTNVNIAANSGTTRARPPYASMSRVCRRS